jgi:monooxygenase
MDKKRVRQVTPQPRGETPAAPFVENFTSGYVQRSLASWPKQGSKAPWRVYQNYIRDIVGLGWAPLNDGALQFSNPKPKASPVPLRESALGR